MDVRFRVPVVGARRCGWWENDMMMMMMMDHTYIISVHSSSSNDRVINHGGLNGCGVKPTRLFYVCRPNTLLC